MRAVPLCPVSHRVAGQPCAGCGSFIGYLRWCYQVARHRVRVGIQPGIQREIGYFHPACGKGVVNLNGVMFLFPLGETRQTGSWLTDPATRQGRFAPGTNVQIVGLGEDLSPGPEGQRVTVAFPDGFLIDWPALDLLTSQERIAGAGSA